MIQVRVSLSIHFAYLWIKHSVSIGSGRCGFVQSVVATPEWMYVQVGRRFVEHQYTQGEPCYPSHAESKIYTIQLDNVLSHIPKSYSPLLGFFSIVSNVLCWTQTSRENIPKCFYWNFIEESCSQYMTVYDNECMFLLT